MFTNYQVRHLPTIIFQSLSGIDLHGYLYLIPKPIMLQEVLAFISLILGGCARGLEIASPGQRDVPNHS